MDFPHRPVHAPRMTRPRVPTAAGAPTAVATWSATDARRASLSAQGFAERRPSGRVDARHVRRTIDRVGLLQMDSIQVLVRAHYLPLFSRLGPYDRTLLDRLAYEKRELFEYWGHEASLLPTRLHPLLRWRMERKPWASLAKIQRERPEAVEAALAAIDARGPLTASEVFPGERGQGSWWGWGTGKHVLEWLFYTGKLSTTERRRFERVYDRTERVLPAHVVATPAPTPDDAKRELLLASARALGIGTARDLADYYRLHKPTARGLLASLVEQGRLERVRVEGWREEAFVVPGTRPPRAPVAARSLLSPFDSLIWERARTERLFGFRYRIEVYTPAAKRRYGYYVLPFLLDEALVARVDLKADRERKTLRVQAAHLEPGQDPERVRGPLREELATMARWLGLDRVVVARKGGFAPALRSARAP